MHTIAWYLEYISSQFIDDPPFIMTADMYVPAPSVTVGLNVNGIRAAEFTIDDNDVGSLTLSFHFSWMN